MDSMSMPMNEQPSQINPTASPLRREFLCNSQEQEKFLPDDGSESSIVMDLRPGRTINSCKRYFIAPQMSGLFIRLVRGDDYFNNSTRRNLTEFCPLSIVSILMSYDLDIESFHIFFFCLFISDFAMSSLFIQAANFFSFSFST